MSCYHQHHSTAITMHPYTTIPIPIHKYKYPSFPTLPSQIHQTPFLSQQTHAAGSFPCFRIIASCQSDMQESSNGRQQLPQQSLDLQLITHDYHHYHTQPEQYLLTLILKDNPWPHAPPAHLHAFLKSISVLYRPVSYHNLTHAFDVMTSFDQYLTRFGWMQRLAVTPHRRIFMLIAAYAHDSGHEGLTNAYYKNSGHALAEGTVSPLQNMHAGNLKRMLDQYQLPLPHGTWQLLLEMILKTDNFYHAWLLQRLEALQAVDEEGLRSEEHAQSMSCILLHAADLNNAAKDFQLSVRWTSELYIEFEKQAALECSLGLPVTIVKPPTKVDYIDSNISFLDHMILPLFRGIALLQPACQEILDRIVNNKQHWGRLREQEGGSSKKKEK